jgi:hypothetical protein
MERTAQCHCGSLRVIAVSRNECMSVIVEFASAAPEPSFIPAALIRKAKFGSRATTRFMSVTRTASRSAFVSARTAAAPLRGTGCPDGQAAASLGRRPEPQNLRDHRGQLRRSELPAANLLGVGRGGASLARRGDGDRALPRDRPMETGLSSADRPGIRMLA